MNINLLVPGHGQIILGKVNVQKTLNKVKQGTEAYLHDILIKLAEHKKKATTLTEICKLIFPSSISYNQFIRLILTYNCLEYLKTNKLLRYHIRGETCYWQLT